MRKKFYSALFICLLTVMISMLFSACNEKPVEVSGKTFVLAAIVGEYPDNYTDEAKKEWDDMFANQLKDYKDKLKWIFNEDGTWEKIYPYGNYTSNGSYVQNGCVIEFTDFKDPYSEDTLTVQGNSIIHKTTFKDGFDSLILVQASTFKLLEE